MVWTTVSYNKTLHGGVVRHTAVGDTRQGQVEEEGLPLTSFLRSKFASTLNCKQENKKK